MKISNIQSLSNEDGIAAIEAVFTIPIIIYIMIVIVGFFQYVGNESLFNYNITRSVQLFDYKSIEREDNVELLKTNFLKELNHKVNTNVIDVDDRSLVFTCFQNIDDLVERKNELECNQSNIKKTNIILIYFELDYKRFSWLFSTIYPSTFLDMKRELVIVNEIY